MSTLESRLFAVETILEVLHHQLQAASDARFTSLKTKSGLLLEHLHRGHGVSGDAGSSAAPPPPGPSQPHPHDDSEFHYLKTPRFPRRDSFDGGDFTLRPQWPHRLDFPRFTDGHDPSA
ncbi:hypothetical protein ACFX2I_007647 [Malus domestica]